MTAIPDSPSAIGPSVPDDDAEPASGRIPDPKELRRGRIRDRSRACSPAVSGGDDGPLSVEGDVFRLALDRRASAESRSCGIGHVHDLEPPASGRDIRQAVPDLERGSAAEVELGDGNELCGVGCIQNDQAVEKSAEEEFSFDTEIVGLAPESRAGVFDPRRRLGSGFRTAPAIRTRAAMRPRSLSFPMCVFLAAARSDENVLGPAQLDEVDPAMSLVPRW